MFEEFDNIDLTLDSMLLDLAFACREQTEELIAVHEQRIEQLELDLKIINEKINRYRKEQS